jgi:NhaC family Na+:H+ antiporter
MAATLGVATFSYLPYAVFNFASPLLAVAIAYFGVRTPVAPPHAAGAAPRREEAS